jgi:hypothetical protein
MGQDPEQFEVAARNFVSEAPIGMFRTPLDPRVCLKIGHPEMLQSIKIKKCSHHPFPHLNMVCFPSDFQIGQNIVLEFPTQNWEHQVFTLIPLTSRDVAINVLASLCSKGPGGGRP